MACQGRLLRFANQQAEAAALARAVKAEIDGGTKAEEILILVRSDANARISSAVQDVLRQLDVALYLPRPPKSTNDDVQRVIDYITLALSLRDDQVDDLAVRALLELDANGIGDTRIRDVLRVALDKSVRFTAALEEIRVNANEYKSNMQAVIRAFDEIVQRAKGISPHDGESFDNWLVRLSEKLNLPDDAFSHLLELTRSVAGVTELELDELSSTSDDVAREEPVQLDYIAALRESMGSLSDVMPSAVPGRVTFTTMHGAKGLTAETVFVLQAEDEVIPGDASGHDFDEARRLLYVSLTRAKKHLVICACVRRTGPQRFSGQSESAIRHLTRFLDAYGLPAQTIEQYLQSG